MKKLLILTLMLGTIAVAAPVIEARSVTANSLNTAAETQMRRGQPRGRWNRRVRTTTTTRIRMVGRVRYRETIRVTYLPNGRTRTQVISRVRVGGRRY